MLHGTAIGSVRSWTNDPSVPRYTGKMSGNADVSLGATTTDGNRMVSEPAFELMVSEIIAYTGAYVAHSAASQATNLLRASQAGTSENEEGGEGAQGESSEDNNVTVLVEPSPASVGTGNALLPVSSQ